MKTAFRTSFLRDLRKLRDGQTKKAVLEVIESVEGAENLTEIPKLRRLSGTRSFYRIRVGDYRIGLALEDDVLEFVRCLHRRDIYRYFP